jgi:hypothetical protein
MRRLGIGQKNDSNEIETDLIDEFEASDLIKQKNAIL